MFYSTDILALKNKTSLAYLFYVSTTDNRSKRLSKNEIDHISITNTIVILKNPPQPFALRLYAILMKGLVKVYAVKIKYIETEISAFHKCFIYKPEVKKNKKIKKLEMKMVFDCVGLGDVNNFIDNVDNSIMNTMTSVENIMINESVSLGRDNFVYANDYSSNPIQNLNEKRIIDSIISLPDEKIKIRKIERSNNTSNHKRNGYFSFYIANKIAQIIKNPTIAKDREAEIEGLRKDSSLMYFPQTSTSFLNQGHCEDNDFFDHNADFEYQVDIEEEINIHEHINFNETVKNISKYHKGIAFIKVLELLNSNSVEVTQNAPYENITVNKL